MRYISILGAALFACGAPDASIPENPQPDSQPNFAQHVRPLLARYCVGCHQVSGVAPFSLERYEDAQRWSLAMANAVQMRRMPPYLADASGDCQNYRDHQWLSAEQIETFVRWAELGAPSGDLNLPSPAPVQPPALSGEVVSVTTGADYLPDQTKTDDYRCFVVDSPGSFAVTGFDIQPGNPKIVHHLIAYQAADESAATQARMLDAQSSEQGYDCLGTGPIVETTSLAGWAPGAGAELFPEGMGVRLKDDLPLILEVHYNISESPGESDQTTMLFQTAPVNSVREMIELIAIDYDFEGPPGAETFTTTDDLPIAWQLPEGGQGRLRLLSANAHMHKRGLSQRLERVSPSGEVDCLMELPRWDFNWQRTYWYETGVEVSEQDTLRITCTFDTRGQEGTLTWGDGTDDEMCLASFFAVVE